jgi:hypothetical protein
MNKLRIFLLVVAFVFIIGWFFLMDYDDLSWSNNKGAYMGIVTGVFLALSMIFSIRDQKTKNGLI